MLVICVFVAEWFCLKFKTDLNFLLKTALKIEKKRIRRKPSPSSIWPKAEPGLSPREPRPREPGLLAHPPLRTPHWLAQEQRASPSHAATVFPSLLSLSSGHPILNPLGFLA